jgi:hypothetical protein
MAKKQRIHYVRFEAPQKVGLLVAAIVAMGSSGAVGYFVGQLSPRSLDSAYVASEPLSLDGSSAVNMPIPSGVFTFDGIFSASDTGVVLPPPPIGTPLPPDNQPMEGSVLAGQGELVEPYAIVVDGQAETDGEAEVPAQTDEGVEVVAPDLAEPAATVQPSRVEQRASVELPARPDSDAQADSEAEALVQPTDVTVSAGGSTTRTVSRGRARPATSASAGSQEVVVSRVSSHEDAESARQALRGASLTATVRRASDGDGFEVVLRTSGSESDRERQEQIGRRVLSGE